MRVVGEGHQFDRQTGRCRRCLVDLAATEAEQRCAYAPQPKAPAVRAMPDLIEANKREAERR